jgi:AcrR family transcriptional regulator
MRTKTAAVEEKVLDAAIALFGSQHFHEVRMEDVAAEAAVGKGTIYRYFSDKEELYQALLDRASRQYLERLLSSAAGADSARARLGRLVLAILQFFDEQPHLFDLIQRSEVMQRIFPWQEARSEAIRLTRSLFEEGNQHGEFEVPDPELATLLLLGGLRTVLRLGEKPRPADIGERILSLFIR